MWGPEFAKVLFMLQPIPRISVRFSTIAGQTANEWLLVTMNVNVTLQFVFRYETFATFLANKPFLVVISMFCKHVFFHFLYHYSTVAASLFFFVESTFMKS